MSFFLSFLSSALVVLTVYCAYGLSYLAHSRKRAYAECWWLPKFDCFRFVIRNMHDENALMGIRYRAWLRSEIQAGLGTSVGTFVDRELISGDRILLPAGQDLPVVCFRVETNDTSSKIVHTDKIGQTIKEYDIDDTFDSIRIEYSLKVRGWFLFKHEILRTFMIPRHLPELDVFMEYLLPIQQGSERRMDAVFLTTTQICVSV